MTTVPWSRWVRPRAIRKLRYQIPVLVACVAAVMLVVFGEVTLPNNPGLGTVVLLCALTGSWLLPIRYAWPIDLAALGAPWAGLALGGVDQLTAKFQFIAIAVTICLAEIAARGLIARDEEHVRLAASLQRFVADAAHELRTPLTALQSQLEVSLRHDRSKDEMTKDQKSALDATRHLIRLSETLLTLAKSDAGALTPHWSDMDMEDLIEEACNRWSWHAKSRQITLSHTAATSGAMEGDSLLLGRVLDNLLENAIRFTPEEGIIEVSLRSVSTDIVVAIQDSGPGVPPELMAGLFDRFSRDDHSRSTARGGAGLGLALCDAIVRAHAGTIDIDSSTSESGPSTGTRVAVTLPVSHERLLVHG